MTASRTRAKACVAELERALALQQEMDGRRLKSSGLGRPARGEVGERNRASSKGPGFGRVRVSGPAGCSIRTARVVRSSSYCLHQTGSRHSNQTCSVEHAPRVCAVVSPAEQRSACAVAAHHEQLHLLNEFVSAGCYMEPPEDERMSHSEGQHEEHRAACVLLAKSCRAVYLQRRTQIGDGVLVSVYSL